MNVNDLKFPFFVGSIINLYFPQPTPSMPITSENIEVLLPIPA